MYLFAVYDPPKLIAWSSDGVSLMEKLLFAWSIQGTQQPKI